ncbi:MAG TPA: cellulose synthase subunit BcsC-related outer membrane protein, partial [Gemmatimonadaceae bacterium]|nr:cellulose synthase subunit BcsC-related outer membrane protein [Gemmatimonadaceae bacterium]
GRGEGRFIADSVRRATGVRLEVAALARDRSRQLDAGGIGMSTSAPFGVARLGLSTMPVTFRDAAGSYSARRDGIDIQYGGPGRVQLVASGARWSVDRAGDAPWEGRLAAELAPAPRLSLLAEIARAVVQETRRSFPGPDDAALAPSGVHATTSRAGFATWWRALDLRASASIGRYEGAGLEPNERLGVDADAGLVVHSHAPWVRVGYAFRAQHFDYDAFDVSAGASRYGGYFSPDRHEVHLGVLQLSHRFGGALLLEFDGRLGGQQVRSVPGRLSDARVAVVTYTHAAWRLTRGLDLDVVFLHVDAFEAFRLNELRAGLRHTF